MDDGFLYSDDWYIDDVILEAVSIAEYSMYDLDCNEVLMESAE